MVRYNPQSIEFKWQKKWSDENYYQAEDLSKKTKYVVLVEFPYPSGTGIHLGHAREYTLGDFMARYKRLQGYNVLFPMGFDAFGLPTENYAIKHQISPIKATKDNMENFEKQMKLLGFSLDWSRMINTSDPAYYKWTQWLFLQFFKHDMAYQKEVSINWCPFCKTGLANEEVVNGRHERCDTLVEKKNLKQWMLRITKYADQLIDGLKQVDYLDKIADQQINWIGRSSGAKIKFKVDQSDLVVEVFTTRIDTIYSAACLILAPEHPLVKQLTTEKNRATVNEYIKETQSKNDVDRQVDHQTKTGHFLGSYAINPINQKLIPIYIADFVLANYGTGAVFGDIHDQRDAEFLKQHNIKASVSVVPKDKELAKKVIDQVEIFGQDGYLINSDQFNGLSSKQARVAILDFLISQDLAEEQVNYRLRDWVFSRQHYWGEPIPIIHCPVHGPVAVPEKDLPVKLPNVSSYQPTDDGKSPLSKIDSFVQTTCPICHQPAKRETDTMPNWAGSSWYYLRYFDPTNDKKFIDPLKLKYGYPVDFYLGGMEHTTLHLLYSRFWANFLSDIKLLPSPEPYLVRRAQGIVLGPDGSKMSKSKGNVVNPLDILNNGYGADSLRLALGFIAPYDLTTAWNSEILAGTYRFLNRVWNLINQFVTIQANFKTEDISSDSEERLKIIINNMISQVEIDLNKLNFNTAIASMMETLNNFYKIYQEDINHIRLENWQIAFETYIIALSVFAPHIAEELWQILGHDDSIQLSNWPTIDHKLLINKEITLIVQVNGKLRGTLVIKPDLDQTQVENLVKQEQRFKPYLDNQLIKKTIFVSNKLINFVI